MTEQAVTTAEQCDVFWHYTIPARSDSKMLLLNLGGVAIIGNWYGQLGEHFLAWCPLPKRDKALERHLFGGGQ